MSAHVVSVEHLSTGWLRWVSVCSCGWRGRSNSSREAAERFGNEHSRRVGAAFRHPAGQRLSDRDRVVLEMYAQSWPDPPELNR